MMKKNNNKRGLIKLKFGLLSALVFSIILSCERAEFEPIEVKPSKDYTGILKELEYKASMISQKKGDKALLRSGLPSNPNNPNDQIGEDHYDFLVALNNDTVLFNQQFANSLSSNLDVKKIQIFEHLYGRIKANNLMNLSATDSVSMRNFLVSYTSETTNPMNSYSAEDGYTTDVKNFLNSYYSATETYRESRDYESVVNIAILYEDTFAADYSLTTLESNIVFNLLAIDKYHSHFFDTTNSGSLFRPWPFLDDLLCIGGSMLLMASGSAISPYLGGFVAWKYLVWCYNQLD